jgi:hypothetical protein
MRGGGFPDYFLGPMTLLTTQSITATNTAMPMKAGTMYVGSMKIRATNGARKAMPQPFKVFP